MKLKSLLLIMAAAAAAPAFSATYYVSPEGAGSKDGSSWENAFGVSELRAQAAKNANGDVYNFAGGLYDMSGATIIFQTATGATLIGNADGERTVFSGDADGSGHPNNGDSNRLIRLQANTKDGDSTHPIVIENIDFTCCYTYIDDANNNAAAFAVDNSGDVTVRNCRFYANWAQGEQGGPAVYIFRSTAKFIDCMFYGNSANYRGGAVRIGSDNENKGIVTFENCVLNNNRNYHGLGGAIFMSHGKSLNIVNTTIANNHSANNGGAIYFNGYDSSHHREVNIVNSTIAGNTTTGDVDDAQIVSTQSAHLSVANSIITWNGSTTAAVLFNGDAASDNFNFVSGGWNYIGAVTDPIGNELSWQSTDNHGDACTYSAIFGDGTLNSDNVLTPTKFYLGATGQQVTDAVASWGLPAGLDLTKDQLGNERLAQMTPGAYAVVEKAVSVGVDILCDAKEAVKLIHIAGDVYMVEGYIGEVEVFAVSGMKVLGAMASSVDLGRLQGGIYMIRAGEKTFKVKK